MKYRLLILCLSAVLAAGLCLVGCAAADTYKINVVSDYGTVKIADGAKAGEKVNFEVQAYDGYTADKVYVNGTIAENNQFVMPEGEVKLLATYAQTGGYAVVCDNDTDDGVTVASLSVAAKGSTVYLHTYVSYGKKVVGYVVNGTKLVGNRFTVQNSDVTVQTEYADAWQETSLNFTVTQSATNATSHWHAEYKQDGLLISAEVEDSDLYSVTSLQRDEAYIDNIEFVLGFADRNGVAWGLDNYKVIIAANGAFRFQRYNGKGWINYSSTVTCKVTQTNLFEDGYAGYYAEMFVPYTALDATYQKALNNVTIAVAMRNAVNGMNSTWNYCGLNGCLWNSPQTHFLITEDGFVLDNKPKSTDYLFVGNGLFALTNWAGFSSAAKQLGRCASVAEKGASIAYWTDNVEQITAIKADTVIFGGGAEDIAEVGVLQAFSRLTKLVDKLIENGTKVMLVSQIPSAGVKTDNDALAAFDGMLSDYAAYTDGVDYLDVCSSLYKDGVVYKSLYKSTDALSDDGYRLLSKLLLTKFDKYVEQGTVWGDNGNFVSTCVWDEDGDKTSLNQGGIQETFLKGRSAVDFEFSVTLTANAVYNSDAWPKMGLTMHGTDGNYYFYIDATATLDNLVAGVVQKTGDTYLWNDVAVGTIPDGTEYARGNYVTMTVRKVGNGLRCSINGNTVIETDVDLGEGSCVVGLFAFNTQTDVSGWSFTDLSATNG